MSSPSAQGTLSLSLPADCESTFALQHPYSSQHMAGATENLLDTGSASGDLSTTSLMASQKDKLSVPSEYETSGERWGKLGWVDDG